MTARITNTYVIACFLVHFSADGEQCTFVVNGTHPLGGTKGIIHHTEEEEEEEVSRQPCYVRGRLNYPKNWYGYLAQFRLRAHNAKIYYHFVYPEEKCCVKILLYLQEQKNLLRHRMNCWQKQSMVDLDGPQCITLSPAHSMSGCYSSNWTEDGVRMIECKSGRTFNSDRVRDLYIAASSCGSPTGLEIEYSFKAYGHVGRCPSMENYGHAPHIFPQLFYFSLCLCISMCYSISALFKYSLST